MKFIQVTAIIITIVFLTACSKDNTTTDQDSAYPGPQVIQSTPTFENITGIPYPQFDDGDSIPPTVVVALLQIGSVEKISLGKNNEAVLFIKDGRTLNVIEPYEDAVQNWIDQCGEICKEIEIVEE